MKRYFFQSTLCARKLTLLQVAVVLTATVLPSVAGVKNWANPSGGSWFDDANWSPAGVPGSSDNVTIGMDGTYTVLVPTGSVASASITLGGGNGTQTLVYGTATGPLFLTNSAVLPNGLLQVTNGGLQGSLLVQAGGQLQVNAGGGLFFYNFALTNQGTVTWSSGLMSVGGNNSDTTTIANQGLFQIISDSSINYGGGSRPILLNSGTVRKVQTTGTTYIGMDLINLPSGLVDVESGTLQFSALQTNVLGGSFTATAPGRINFVGNQTDAGGSVSGTGTAQFNGGTFYLRTNPIPQLRLTSGYVYVDANTFQQAGAITNLTLEGAQLRGTNRVAGMLTIDSGDIADIVTVLPGGELVLGANGSGTHLYSSTLINQGTVLWNGGLLSVGDTVISNGGTWTITSDSSMNYGGGALPYFSNYGLVEKSGGTGVSSLAGVTFLNETSGIVRAASGTLQMPNNYTNTAGTLLLDGGTLTDFGGLGMTGGELEGTGTVGAACVFDAGIVSPGQGPGLIQFKSGLTLGSGVTLMVDGTGTVPGTQYDQLSVAGPVALSNCTLQVTALPTVPPGTGFAIIAGQSGVSGTFNGLPENSSVTVGAQVFGIHYGAGGSTVTLVLESTGAPQLTSAVYANGALQLTGTGSGSTTYNIQATTNFTDWINVGTAPADASGNFSFTDPNAGSFAYRFYRASR